MKYILKNLVLILVVFLAVVSVSAQDPSVPTSEGMHWFCLSKVSADPSTHTAVLTVKEGVGYQDGKDAAVVVRIAFDHELDGAVNLTADNSGMTTADPGLDLKILGGTQGLEELQSKLGFSNAGIVDGSNPTKTFPVTWKDDLANTSGGAEDRAHYWYGVQEAVPVGDTAAGGAGAQQQGTFTFDQAASAKDCDVVRWDPFGYVFDAQTHGAVAGVYVRILTSTTENGVYTPVPVGIGKGMVGQNPILTQKDGSYRFYVDPGYYKLELLGDKAKSAQKYTIEKNITTIKPGFEEFGYEQIYIAQNAEVIHELTGKVERRDIAIETIGAPAPFSVDGPKLKDITVNRSVKNRDQMVRISGMVSQIPVDFTAIYKDINDRVTSEEKFSLKHGHTYVPAGLHDERNFDLWIRAQSKDGSGVFKELRITSKYSNKVITLPISPMPSFLDGIANTKSGVPMVGGTVGIYPIGRKKPSYTTKTDEKGHFVVRTEWIPPFPYELRYTTITGDVTKVTTTDYLKQNITYHKENLINSYSVNTTEPDTNTAKTNNGTKKEMPQPTGTQVGGIAASRIQGIIIVVIVLMILVAIGVGTFILMRSKQQPPLT